MGSLAGADLQSLPLLQTILFDIDDVFSALMAEVRITNPHQHGQSVPLLQTILFDIGDGFFSFNG
jgi:hypothetical protein